MILWYVKYEYNSWTQTLKGTTDSSLPFGKVDGPRPIIVNASILNV